MQLYPINHKTESHVLHLTSVLTCRPRGSLAIFQTVASPAVFRSFDAGTYLGTVKAGKQVEPKPEIALHVFLATSTNEAEHHSMSSLLGPLKVRVLASCDGLPLRAAR